MSGMRSLKVARQVWNTLAHRLKLAIRTKRRGLLSKKVLLQHDNARPDIAKATIETVNKLGFEVLKHPAYSPDLAPSDYRLFAPLKDALRGCKFSSDEAVQKMVHEWLWDQPKTFFSDGLGLGTHLFVKVLRAGDSEVTFVVFESSCHLLLPV